MHYFNFTSFLLLAPLLNFIALAGFGRFLGAKGSKLHTYLIFLSLNLYYLYMFFDSYINEEFIVQYTILNNWINIGNLQLDSILFLDGLSQIMCFLVIIVSSIVHIYAFYYMDNDGNLIRFISYLSLFTFSMLLLILSENFLLFFSAWELVGLASFLLIGFWSTRNEARKSALKAVILNRFGDCALIAAMGLIYSYTQSNQFHTIFATLAYSYDFINFLLFIGCMAKSAQLFLHIWLLDAMEGPTPVSALLHAATMVTAGVYLIMRFSYVFEYSNHLIYFITVISTLTIIFGATSAVVQSDLKKTIAYSTCSQLGYMFTACAFSGYSQALFHLFTHGFFKALLFLSAGLIIHNFSDEQDMRKMGGLINVLPITYTFFFIGSLAIIGFPFLAGFYSKDGILELIYSTTFSPEYAIGNLQLRGLFAYALSNLGIFFTTFYSLKLLYYVFLTKPNGFKSYFHLNFSGQEAPILILLCLSFLSIGSIFIGFFFKDLIIGSGNDFLDFSLFNRIFSDFTHNSTVFGEKDYFLFIESYAFLKFIKIIPITIIVFSLIFSYVLLSNSDFSFLNHKFSVFYRETFKLLQGGFFLNFIILSFSKHMLKFFRSLFLVEKAFLEQYGPYGFTKISWNFSRQLTFLHLPRDFKNYISTALLSSFFVLYIIFLLF